MVLLPFCGSAGWNFARFAKKKCHFGWVPVMTLSWNFHKFSSEDWRLLCCTETFEFACVSAHTKQVLTCDRFRRYEFHFLKKLLNFRTKLNVSRLVLDMKKYIFSKGTIPFCKFFETHFFEKTLFLVSFKTSDFRHCNKVVSWKS